MSGLIHSSGLLSFMGLLSAVTSVFRKFLKVVAFLILILVGPLNGQNYRAADQRGQEVG